MTLVILVVVTFGGGGGGDGSGVARAYPRRDGWSTDVVMLVKLAAVVMVKFVLLTIQLIKITVCLLVA